MESEQGFPLSRVKDRADRPENRAFHFDITITILGVKIIRSINKDWPKTREINILISLLSILLV